MKNILILFNLLFFCNINPLCSDLGSSIYSLPRSVDGGIPLQDDRGKYDRLEKFPIKSKLQRLFTKDKFPEVKILPQLPEDLISRDLGGSIRLVQTKQNIIISGDKSVGKSIYAQMLLQHVPESTKVVFTIDLTSLQTISTTLKSLYRKICHKEDIFGTALYAKGTQITDFVTMFNFIRHLLSNYDQWLLVLDNIDLFTWGMVECSDIFKRIKGRGSFIMTINNPSLIARVQLKGVMTHEITLRGI